MIHIHGDAGKTETYTKREWHFLGGLDWADGRCGTVILNHFRTKGRIGIKSNFVSTYSIGEVKDTGFRGRVFIMDKIGGADEHEETDRKPPYTVKLSKSGETWCSCMAASCKAPTCRHVDVLLCILDQGGLDVDS